MALLSTGRFMRKYIVSQRTTNRLLAYAAIVMIVVQSILSYFMLFSLSKALVTFGLAAAMFSLPLILYFIKPSSAIFKYLFVFFAITYMFVILYIQKGSIDNIFLLYVILASASLYFNVKFTLYTTAILCTETMLGLIFLREALFPLMVPASVMSLIVNFLVIGALLAFQGEWGKRMIISYEFGLRQVDNRPADTNPQPRLLRRVPARNVGPCTHKRRDIQCGDPGHRQFQGFQRHLRPSRGRPGAEGNDQDDPGDDTQDRHPLPFWRRGIHPDLQGNRPGGWHDDHREGQIRRGKELSRA